jgi:hypothetical protein
MNANKTMSSFNINKPSNQIQSNPYLIRKALTNKHNNLTNLREILNAKQSINIQNRSKTNQIKKLACDSFNNADQELLNDILKLTDNSEKLCNELKLSTTNQLDKDLIDSLNILKQNSLNDEEKQVKFYDLDSCKNDSISNKLSSSSASVSSSSESIMNVNEKTATHLPSQTNDTAAGCFDGIGDLNGAQNVATNSNYWNYDQLNELRIKFISLLGSDKSADISCANEAPNGCDQILNKKKSSFNLTNKMVII